MDLSRQRDVISGLLKAGGMDGDDFAMEPARSGGNNRVLIIRVPEGAFIAKWYFSDASDPRDRLATEWSFFQFAVKTCPSSVPRPFSRDAEGRAALYEYIEGDPLSPGEVTAADVDAACDFLAALNDPGFRVLAADLPEASEACFSIEEHLQLVNGRLERLERVDFSGETDSAARSLVREMTEFWDALQETISGRANRLGLALADRLPEEERCVSPSDFGFHNAIRRPDGSICFIDFEYAGWDDPSKTAADFFLQPAMPVDTRHRERFAAAAFGHLPQARRGLHRGRAELLRPLFGLKWCCIILNPFLPGWAARRVPEGAGLDLAQVRQERLRRAKQALETLQRTAPPSGAMPCPKF